MIDAERKLREAIGFTIGEAGKCPSAESIYAFCSGKLTGQERAALDRHLLACQDCMESWREMRSFMEFTRDKTAVSTTNVASLRKWAAAKTVKWILAAAAGIVCAVIGGAVALKLRPLPVPEPAPKPIVVASVQKSELKPEVARTLDLAPESMTLRGDSPEQAVVELDSLATDPLVLVLNTLDELPPGITAKLSGPDGKCLWSQDFKTPPPRPLTLVIPAAGFAAGRYSVLLKDSATDKKFDSFSFEITVGTSGSNL